MKNEKYKVELYCPNCKNLLNNTKPVIKEEAEKLYREALSNPLLGWCNDCDRKPIPKILKVNNE